MGVRGRSGRILTNPRHLFNRDSTPSNEKDRGRDSSPKYSPDQPREQWEQRAGFQTEIRGTHSGMAEWEICVIEKKPCVY